jgi:hypothetical protein
MRISQKETIRICGDNLREASQEVNMDKKIMKTMKREWFIFLWSILLTFLAMLIVGIVSKNWIIAMGFFLILIGTPAYLLVRFIIWGIRNLRQKGKAV